MSHAKQSLRLWLKLLAVTGRVEKVVRGQLRTRFDTTLPRFDVLAMLDFAGPKGLNMGELSRNLMVSNGNVTGIVARLEQEGLVKRWADSNDRRTFWVALTDDGQKSFNAQAGEHEKWIETLMHDMNDNEMSQLITLLDRLRHAVDLHQGEITP